MGRGRGSESSPDNQGWRAALTSLRRRWGRARKKEPVSFRVSFRVSVTLVSIRFVSFHFVVRFVFKSRCDRFRFVPFSCRFFFFLYVTLRFDSFFRFVTLRFVTFRYASLRFFTLFYVSFRVLSCSGWWRFVLAPSAPRPRVFSLFFFPPNYVPAVLCSRVILIFPSLIL